MKKLLLLFALPVFSNGMAQKNHPSHINMDSLVTAIDRDHSLKNFAIDVSGMASERSVFAGYYDKSNNVKKLVVRHFGEMGNTVTTYYITEGQLIFQKRISNIYDKPLYMKGYAVKSDSVSIDCSVKKSGCDQSSFARDLSVFRKPFETFVHGRDDFGDVIGEWTVLDYYPEVSGLTPEEKGELQQEKIGQTVSIGENRIAFKDFEIDGKLQAKIEEIRIVENDVIDPESATARFFCQDLLYFDAIRKGSMRVIDQTYREDFMRVSRFTSNEGEEVYVFIYHLSEEKIALCIPGDSVYNLAKKIVK